MWKVIVSSTHISISRMFHQFGFAFSDESTMQNTIFIFSILIFGFIFGISARGNRVLVPTFQVSLNQFRKIYNQKGLLPTFINIQEKYATIFKEISEDLLLRVPYKQNDTDYLNQAVENLCNQNENLRNLLYSAADSMLRCFDNSDPVVKNSMTEVMLDHICTEQKFRYEYNRNYYHDEDRECIWNAAQNISKCYAEECTRRLWRIAENCDCDGEVCNECSEICYDPFHNNILLYVPINFSQKECNDLYRRIRCQLDPIRHCRNSHLKESYESIYSLERVHHCLSKVPDWR